MKVSSTAETKIQTKDSPFDIENGVLKNIIGRNVRKRKTKKRL